MRNPGLFDAIVQSVLTPPLEPIGNRKLKVADCFCGIGGFHVAAENLGTEVVWACDIDRHARYAYEQNFDLEPKGDIREVKPADVPKHDILCAGFPCQPFSIIGLRQGLSDPRGILFFELLRLLRVKRPRGVILENVKQLSTIENGAVMERIVSELQGLGYRVDWRVLNALNYGLPQKRERTIIVGTQSELQFRWPRGGATMTPLADILETNPDPSCFVTESIRKKRQAMHTPEVTPSIWHENKAGNISSHPWSCALRAGASYNYLLVNGERHPTMRELLRLQGFPDAWKIVCNQAQTKRQVGNAVPVPMVQAVLESMVNLIERTEAAWREATDSRPASSPPGPSPLPTAH